MTDIVLKSQLKSDDIFYLPSFKDGMVMDDFLPNIPHASQPGFWRKVRISPTGTATAGGENTFFVPPHGTLLSDMYAILQFAAPSAGTYSSYIANQAIERVVIDFNGETLHDYNYRPVFQHHVSLWPVERTAQILSAGGGVTPSAVTACTPIFTFWGSWKHDKNDFVHPLPFSVSNTSMRVAITLDAVADLLAAGASGGSLSALTLVYYEFIASTSELARIEKVVRNEEWRVLGIDYQTLSPTTVATATATDIDLTGLQGSIKEICYPVVLATDISTAHNYLITNISTAISLLLDGIEIYDVDSSNEGIMDSQIFNQGKVGNATAINTARCINFSRRKDSHNYDGGLNSESFKRFTLNITHTLGANASVFISAAMYRWYVYRGGRFVRVKN